MLSLLYNVALTLQCCPYSTLLPLLYNVALTLQCCPYSTMLSLLDNVALTLQCCPYSTVLLLLYKGQIAFVTMFIIVYDVHTGFTLHCRRCICTMVFLFILLYGGRVICL